MEGRTPFVGLAFTICLSCHRDKRVLLPLFSIPINKIVIALVVRESFTVSTGWTLLFLQQRIICSEYGWTSFLQSTGLGPRIDSIPSKIQKCFTHSLTYLTIGKRTAYSKEF